MNNKYTIELTEEQKQAFLSLLGDSIPLQSTEDVTQSTFKLNQGRYFINASGSIQTIPDELTPESLFLDKTNNVWCSWDDVEEAVEYKKTLNALLQRWFSLVGDWRPDWTDNDEKFAPYFDAEYGDWYIAVQDTRSNLSPFVFETEEQCHTFIHDMREYLERFIGYYS